MGNGEKKGNLSIQRKPVQSGQQFIISVEGRVPMKCECGSEYFTTALRVYRISAIESPVGKEMTAQQAVLICNECKKPLDLGASQSVEANS